MNREKLSKIGQRVKTARKALRVPQKEMADKLGVSPSHLSEIESGKANPSTEFHLKLSDLYNISVEYIYHGRGNIFYEDDGKITDEPFDFKSDVDSTEKLNWLVKNSAYFKHLVLGYASKLIIQEESTIKESIKKNKN